MEPEICPVHTNTAQTQIGLCTWMPSAIVEKRLHLPHRVFEIESVLNLTMFEISSPHRLAMPLLPHSDGHPRGYPGRHGDATGTEFEGQTTAEECDRIDRKTSSKRARV